MRIQIQVWQYLLGFLITIPELADAASGMVR